MDLKYVCSFCGVIKESEKNLDATWCANCGAGKFDVLEEPPASDSKDDEGGGK